MWVLLAFCSAFCAGITAVLAKIGIKNTDSNIATAIRTVIILLFLWLIVFLSGSYKTIPLISGKTLLFLILSGVATGASWLCYFRALQIGDVNKVTPVDRSSILLTMILGFIILGEAVSPTKIIGLIAIGAGTYLMIVKKQTEHKDVKNNRWFIYAALSTVFASLTSILGKIGIEGVESNLGTAIRTIVVLIMAWLIVFISGRQKEIKHIDRKSRLFISLSAITTGLSWLFYYSALKDGDASIVAPIDKLSIIVTIVFSRLALKEKLSKKAFVGLIALVGGTLILLV